MNAIKNWNAGQLDRYRTSLAAGHHDVRCEQRERFGLCGCGKRQRLVNGPSEPPVLWYQSPLCSHCMGAVHHDGDGWTCDRCHVSWGSNDYDEPGTFNDEPGDLSDATSEKWGRRMIHLAYEADAR